MDLSGAEFHKQGRSSRASKIRLFVSMCIFGTIGIIRKYIPMDSMLLSCIRAGIGAVSLYAVIRLSGRKLSVGIIRKKFIAICLDGIIMGFNWVFMFESMNHTTLAVTTICYYMEPIFIILVSPFLFRERITVPKLFCIGASVIGIVFVSGFFSGDSAGLAALDAENIKGILFALLASVLYAACVVWNKVLSDVPVFDRTLTELAAACIVMIPLCIFRGVTADIAAAPMQAWLLILILGVFHTGITYGIYYTSVNELPAQTIAFYSYMDPVLAVLLSWLVLKEPIDIWIIMGGILIFGSAMASDLIPQKTKENKGNNA